MMALVAFASATGCIFFSSFDGLTGGEAPSDAMVDGSDGSDSTLDAADTGIAPPDGSDDSFDAISDDDAAPADTVDSAEIDPPEIGPCETAPIWCYPDKDGDKHGAPTGAVGACGECPTGFVTSGDDCNDENASVYPGVPTFFTVGYCKPPVATPCTTGYSFDYDCDGKETGDTTKTFPTSGCPAPVGTSCSLGPQGWSGGVPACGTEGNWAKCNYSTGSGGYCFKYTEKRVLACR